MAFTTSIAFPASTITTSSGIVGPFDITGYQVVSVGTYGTHSGVNITFEVSSDNNNWYPIFASNINAGATSSTSGTLTTNASTAYDIVVGPFSWFRVRSTAYTSGTLNVQVSGGTAAYETSPNVNVVNNPTIVPSMGTAAGGTATNHHLVSAATTNATSVKATAGSIGHIVMVNTSAALKYVKLFNKASAPTVGTDTPTVTFQIPATSQVIFDPSIYYRMSSGIAYAITNLSPDLDATAVAAGDIIVSLNYV